MVNKFNGKTMNNIDEYIELKTQTKQIRKQRFFVSRLDKFKGELLVLYKKGTTISELQRWLRKKRIKVAYSTVHRWMQKNG